MLLSSLAGAAAPAELVGSLSVNQNEFACYRIRREAGQQTGYQITGAPLTSRWQANILLRQVPRILKQPDGITRAVRLMVALQRRIADDNPTVGRHAMAVVIPCERSAPVVMSNLDAPTLSTGNSNFCYFDEAGNDYRQLGPHMAGGGWAWADFLAEADPLNPDNQKISMRLLKHPESPPRLPSSDERLPSDETDPPDSQADSDA
jgi:hypothetical protein